ncbi:hypothetical protein DICPUDRAFT_99674 [Dictyostelium purpureum]|uniref:Uncharacterized protein n=1 Tax=Dictyostelium purpureum TaxID=5786 RepID=F1A1F8_DICPU|nr:uncharacterized protein DICPUDRAFT_99674 [Dictyostelium purpureum]EGC29962.1 hypothetical protein DICPUDRAFT_99674 [Dictyostelium purpureum]|eukprot:XP_003293501.1 hypothetical protein DICPUDRAFT_99674 [Dictyostelium purpureum]
MNEENNNNNNGFHLQPTLIQMSEILQHSVELKLCSSIETHNVFWDTLLYNIEDNGDAISMIISLLLTKYIMLFNNEKSSNTLLQSLFTKLTNAPAEEFFELLNNSYRNSVNINNNNNNNNNNNSTNNSPINTSLDNSTTAGEEDDGDESESDSESEDEVLNNEEGNNNNDQQKRKSKKVVYTELETFNNSTTVVETSTTVIYTNNGGNTSQPTTLSTSGNSINLSQPSTPPSNELNSNYNNNSNNFDNIFNDTTSTTINYNYNNLTSEELKESESNRLLILSTIGYLSLFYTFNPQFPTLKVILNKINQLQFDKNKSESSFLAEIARILQNGYQDNNDFIFFLIDQCSETQISNDNQRQIKMGSWYSACIRKILRDESINKSNEILSCLLLFLKHPLLTKRKVLILLQMLKHLLLITPVISPGTIETALTLVKTYYHWPKPYCTFAKEILELLSLESKCPGSYFRNMLTVEFPSIIAQPNSISANNLTNTLFSNKNRPTVHFLVDKYNSEALLIQELFENSSSATYLPTITQLQSNNIENIFKRILGVDNTQLGLEYLEPIDVSQFHFKILEIMNKTMYLEKSTSIAARIEQLCTIRDEIIKASSTNNTPFSHKPKAIELPPLSYQFNSLLTLSVRQKRPDQYATQYQIPINKKTTNALITLLSKYQDQDYQEQVKFAIVGNDASIQHVLGAYLFLRIHSPELFEDLELLFYILPTNSQNLYNNCRISDFISSFDFWYHKQVSICLKSIYNIIPSFIPVAKVSNLERQSFIESISQIKDLRSSMSIPKEETNKLNISKEQVLSPPQSEIDNNEQANTATNNNDKKMDHDLIETPSHIIQSEVEYLFREASFCLDIPVVKCEGWTDDQYYTIPFLMKAEINIQTFIVANSGDMTINTATLVNTLSSMNINGSNSVALSNLDNNDSGDNGDGSNTNSNSDGNNGDGDNSGNNSNSINSESSQLAKLISKYQPTNVSIKIQQCNQMGQSLQWINIESKSYYGIEINNIMPKSTIKSSSSSSSSNQTNTAANFNLNKQDNQMKPKMEIHLVEAEQKKKKIISSEDLFRFFTTVIEIESPDKKKTFDILLDGQLHGPFNKIKLSFCSNKDTPTVGNTRNSTVPSTVSPDNSLSNDDFITFPIMTFLPLE